MGRKQESGRMVCEETQEWNKEGLQKSTTKNKMADIRNNEFKGLRKEREQVTSEQEAAKENDIFLMKPNIGEMWHMLHIISCCNETTVLLIIY